MRRRVLSAAALATALCLAPLTGASSATSPPHVPSDCATTPEATPAGPMYRCTFTDPQTATPPFDDAATSRVYWLHVPPDDPGNLPLLVYLHGCTQNGVDAAYGTAFNELAARAGFIVAYPQQNQTQNATAPFADGNGTGCWNWFLPEDQQRGSGEPRLLADLTRTVMDAEQADPDRVYVEGASAGADMSVILAATYPDLYAAYGAIAGCAYATCSDVTGGQTVRAMGANARVVPGFVEQGTADTLNAYPLGQGLVESWLGALDSIEQQHGGGVSRQPASTTSYDVNAPDPAASGNDPCEPRSGTFPCPGGIVGFQGSYPYTVQKYADSAGCDVLDFWIVHGLEHAYPGGRYGGTDPTYGPMGTFIDPLGPNVTEAAWSFFLAHPKGACAPSAEQPPTLAESPLPVSSAVAGLAAMATVAAVVRRRRPRAAARPVL